MAKILIFTEIHQDRVKTVTLEILGALSEHSVDVVGVNALSDSAQQQLKKYGAEKILCLKSESLNKYSPESYAQALNQYIKANTYDYVFAGATALGKDLFPRLAGMFEAGMVSDLTGLSFQAGELKGTRPLFAGKCVADVSITGPKPHFATIRPNALGLNPEPSAKAGELHDFSDLDIPQARAVIKEIIQSASEKLDLTEANIIVSGGRSLKSRENFKILNELADVLGATVGASRAAVDSGYADHSMQVGQTGKTVSPTLYIACGISGAIQHLAGMRTSKVIVCINTDPNAPIFEKADYGIIGDLFKIVPLMTEEFKKLLK